jgi:hypothetical protein
MFYIFWYLCLILVLVHLLFTFKMDTKVNYLYVSYCL